MRLLASAMYAAARSAITARQSGARVIIGGLTRPVPFLAAMLAADPGLRGQIDGVGIHPYGSPPQVLAGVRSARLAMDADGLAAAMADLGVAPPSDDVTALRYDLAEFMDTYRTATLADLQVRVLLGDMLAVIRRHHLTLPHQLALLLKTVTTAEGVALQLDPSFELLPLLVPYASALEQPAPDS